MQFQRVIYRSVRLVKPQFSVVQGRNGSILGHHTSDNESWLTRAKVWLSGGNKNKKSLEETTDLKVQRSQSPPAGFKTKMMNAAENGDRLNHLPEVEPLTMLDGKYMVMKGVFDMETADARKRLQAAVKHLSEPQQKYFQKLSLAELTAAVDALPEKDRTKFYATLQSHTYDKPSRTYDKP